MKLRNIFGISLVAALALAGGCAEKDMTKVDEWLGEKFNQEILWNQDSMAFRRAAWVSEDVGDGLQMRKSQVKMWESVQTISYVSYSPNSFNTYLGYTGSEGTVAELAGNYEGALFAVNAGELTNGKPADYFKVDGQVITSVTSSIDNKGLIGLSNTPVGVKAKISLDLTAGSDYTSAMVYGPLLLMNGKEREFPKGEFYDTRMARTIFGIATTGNYVMGVIDGGVDGQADGATVAEAAFVARLMGLESAVLLGCDDQSTAWSSGKGVLNAPASGAATKVGSVLYIGLGTARMKGDGTEESPYLIENYVNMTQMRSLTAEGTQTYFRMEADVDMSEVKLWTPVNFDGEYKRQVYFDGNNKTITNFAPTSFVADDQTTEAAYASIFGVLYGTCKDLTIKNSEVKVPLTQGSASGILGGFVGTANLPATVENVHILDCKVTGGRDVALFGGQARDASLKGCTARGTVVGGNADAGGFLGRVAGYMSLEDCHSDVHLSPGQNPGSNMRYGGVVGFAATIGGTDLTRDYITVKNCTSTGTIYNGEHTCNCSGGIVAYMQMPKGLISGCSSSIEIKCDRTDASGSGGKLSNSGAICGVVSTADEITVENCYSTGRLNPWQCSSGVVGRLEKGILNITNCYTTSEILGYSGLGAILGQSMAGTTLTVTNCFAWNPSIVGYRDGEDKYSCGVIAGSAEGTCTFIGCLRNPAMVFTDPFRTMQEHADLAAGTPEGAANQNAYDGRPSSAKTLSEAAQSAGWPASVWDFSGDVPVLK